MSRRKRGGRRAAAMNAVIENRVSGRGGIQDRAVGEYPSRRRNLNPFVHMNDPARAAQYAWVLYTSDWAARKIVDIPVFDMFREGWNWLYRGRDTDVDARLEDECRRLDLRTVLSRAKRMERLFGGCVVVIGARGRDGERTEDPLTPDQVDRGDLRFLNQIGRNFVSRVDWDLDPNSERYGRPLLYHVRDRVFHRSRLLVFDGNPISPYPGQDFMTATGNWDGMGVSALAPVWDALMRAEGAQQGAAHLIETANIWIALRRGLEDLQATRSGRKALSELERMVESFSMYRGYVASGDNVDVKQLSASFGGVPETMLMFLQILSAGSDIPATRFLGEAPGGLNADGRSSLENYYNSIAAQQRIGLEPLLEQLKPLLLNSAFGAGAVDPRDIGVEWPPLWNMSKREEAEIRKTDVDNALALRAARLLSESETIDELRGRRALHVRPSGQN